MIDLNAPIQDVTVYADRALITRHGSTELEAGEHELRINNLPQFIGDSLRASGQGPQGTRILNVDISTAFHSQPPEATLRTLQDELDTLLQNKQLLEARQSALNDRRQWLRALGEQSKDFAKGLAQGQMKPQDCADFFTFAAAQALQDAEAAQSLELQLKQAHLEIAAKKREIAQQRGGISPDRLAAIVTVELVEAGEFTLDLSYLVMGASWHPQYDVRVQMSDEQSESATASPTHPANQTTESGEVDLTYVAIVQQSTGERWENISLSLSTARPSLAASLPELEPWYLNVYNPTPVVRGPMFARAMSAPQGAPGNSYGAALSSEQTVKMPAVGTALTASMSDTVPDMEPALPPTPIAAAIATTTVEQTGTSLIFRAGRSVDIPSDNSPHKTTISRDNLHCTFDYVCAPVLEENVHLRAAIINTTDRVLLAGDASIFLGGEYVGTTRLKMTAPTEKFKIFLGIDDGIKVKRELTDHSVDKGSMLQSAIRRTTYAYRITVHNYARATRDVVIRDHLPVAQHERIKVKVQNVQPPPTERTKLEILVWKFVLSPAAEQIIDYRFVVEHPQDVVITGLT